MIFKLIFFWLRRWTLEIPLLSFCSIHWIFYLSFPFGDWAHLVNFGFILFFQFYNFHLFLHIFCLFDENFFCSPICVNHVYNFHGIFMIAALKSCHNSRSVSSQCWHLSIIFHIQLEIFSLGGTNEFSLFPRYDGYNIKIHWILFKSSVLVDFLWHCTSGKKGSIALLLLERGKSSGFPIGILWCLW